jgi:hypothetical protein
MDYPHYFFIGIFAPHFNNQKAVQNIIPPSNPLFRVYAKLIGVKITDEQVYPNTQKARKRMAWAFVLQFHFVINKFHVKRSELLIRTSSFDQYLYKSGGAGSITNIIGTSGKAGIIFLKTKLFFFLFELFQANL